MITSFHRFSARDGRRKRMEKDAFSNENVLGSVHTNTFSFENVSFSMRFCLPSTLKWCKRHWKRRFSKTIPKVEVFENACVLKWKRIVWTAKTKFFENADYLHFTQCSINQKPVAWHRRKRYENASVDLKLLLRFQWNGNGGFWKTY